ncbi:MAG: MFS transporter [Candidatus Cryosericum sp.]
MNEEKVQLYGYRWVVLAVFMFINITIQMLWISYSPVTGPAAAFYGVTDLKIGLLSMIFMAAFLPLSIPASWAIDAWGFHRAVSVGAVFMGICGILRGLAGASYPLVLASTVGIAVAQPFLLNAWTTVPAKWFDVEFRATAVGLVTLASLLGIAAGMVLTPLLTQRYSIAHVQLLYGVLAACSAVLFIALAREKPPTPPCRAGGETRALMLDGLRNALANRMFWMFLAVCFVALGLFNGLSTWVEPIVRPRGFSPEQAGTLGALLLVGGIIGAVVIPAFSDRQHKRRKFLMIGILGAIPGLFGVTFARSAWLLMASAFELGFFLTSLSPVGMQYAAEITYPTPEGTSNGLIQLFGQAAVVYVYVMQAMRTRDGSFTVSLLFGVFLLIICAFIAARLKDPDPARSQAPESWPGQSGR